MSLPLPVHVAASLEQAVVWFVVAVIWLVFQGLASKSKQSPPPPTVRPTPRPEPSPTRPVGDELREFIATLTGQKLETTESEEEEEAPALPRPTPPPPPVRNVMVPPKPLVQFARKTVSFTRQTAPLVSAAEPPPAATMASLPMPARETHPVFVPTTTTREALRLAPLMKMQWPRSPLSNLSITATTRTGQRTLLHRRLRGHAALRYAMVSRIVLGRPLGD